MALAIEQWLRLGRLQRQQPQRGRPAVEQAVELLRLFGPECCAEQLDRLAIVKPQQRGIQRGDAAAQQALVHGRAAQAAVGQHAAHAVAAGQQLLRQCLGLGVIEQVQAVEQQPAFAGQRRGQQRAQPGGIVAGPDLQPAHRLAIGQRLCMQQQQGRGLAAAGRTVQQLHRLGAGKQLQQAWPRQQRMQRRRDAAQGIGVRRAGGRCVGFGQARVPCGPDNCGDAQS